MFDSLRRWTGTDPRRPAADRRHRRGDGRRRRRLRAAQRLARARRPADLQRRGRRVGRAAPGPLRRARRRRPCAADGGGARAAPLRQRARLQGPAHDPLAVGGAPDRPPLLPALRHLRRARRAVLHPGRPHRPAAAVGDRAPDPLHRPGGDRLPRAGDRVRPHRLPVDRGDGRRRAQARARLHRHLGVHCAPLSARAGRVPAHPRRQPQDHVRLQPPDDRAAAGARAPRCAAASTTRRSSCSSTATPSGCSACEREPDRAPARHQHRAAPPGQACPSCAS